MHGPDAELLMSGRRRSRYLSVFV